MDPLLLAAMTLVTLAAGGVYSWLLDRALRRGPMQELLPRLDELTVLLQRAAHQLDKGQETQALYQQTLVSRLLALENGTAESGPRQDLIVERLRQTHQELEGLSVSVRGQAARLEELSLSSSSSPIDGQLPWSRLEERLLALEQSGVPVESRLNQILAQLRELELAVLAAPAAQGNQPASLKGPAEQHPTPGQETHEGAGELGQELAFPVDMAGAPVPEFDPIEGLLATSEILKVNLVELELALDDARQMAAMARAENQILRSASQAELERIARHYAQQIAAIAVGLESLDRAVERRLGQPA